MDRKEKRASRTRLTLNRRSASMFARKKTVDVPNALQRFCDLQREPSSRAKHFRNATESLQSQERGQIIADYSFETFHLIDLLLLHPDLSAIDGQVLMDAESALLILEQVLCYVPELVGQGWQRNGIETILKRALLPHNLFPVRRLAIRLFLLWYQELSLYKNTGRTMDVVFQSCLPYFPLKDGQQTEKVLQAYCECPSAGLASPPVHLISSNGYFGFDPVPPAVTPIIVDGALITPAQMTQMAGTTVITPTTPTPNSTQTMLQTSSIADGNNGSVRGRATTLQVSYYRVVKKSCDFVRFVHLVQLRDD